MELKSPINLYEISLLKVIEYYHIFKDHLTLNLSIDALFDVYYELMKKNDEKMIINCDDFDIFIRFITDLKGKRNHLHQLFQSLMDNETGIAKTFQVIYCQRCVMITNVTDRLSLLKSGINFGTFLYESGWYWESESVFNAAINMVTDDELKYDENLFMTVFECKWKLLSVYNSFCRFSDAQQLKNDIQLTIDTFNLINQKNKYNLSRVYMEFAHFYFLQSYYDDSYKWAVKSLAMIDNHSPTLTLIDVLRQSAKTCVVKREFKRAEMLLNQTLIICKEIFNLNENGLCNSNTILHPKLADVLLDYGFYLLNVDLISISVRVYEMALNVRERIFGYNSHSNCFNLLIAIAQEELAYACYVHEYSSGIFDHALYNAEKALTIVKRLLPKEHLLLASAKRVKALILEEIAIDHHDKSVEEKYLIESQHLHLSALSMAKAAFGEFNVQTAKHYGNLGRLYQSMKRYAEAESMHLKAISIKEQLLGPNDYEVALSLGHLASLYNYDMGMFEKAEELYLRSIEIGFKLYGRGYSGLEYDYRGLIRVYSSLYNYLKLSHYENKLREWQQLRDMIMKQVRESPIIKDIKTAKKLPIENILLEFESL